MSVNFDGLTYLASNDMQGYFQPNYGYTCGVVSYWFNSTVVTDAAILQVWLDFPNGKVSGVSVIRVEHNLGFARNTYGGGLSVFLQNAFNGSFDPNVFYVLDRVDPDDLELFYDGAWHHVLITW